MTTYIGKSGQRWYEIERTETCIVLRPEYPNSKSDRIHIPLAMLAACGFREIESRGVPTEHDDEYGATG